ncbi:MAG: phosphate regulon sensor histidine kinase PhoR [Gammaproteobacteria bacterium]|nr:phosphate regulon sensor histidine kinase PhoR [Gammaproteobacteria bacterium]
MSHHPWLNELWRFIALNVLALMIGLVIGEIVLALFFAFVFYFFWHLYHLYQLERWIVSRDTSSPPNASGIWGDVFHHFYKLQRRNRKRKKKLANMLARFQASTAAMPDATIVLNAENEIEWFNKAAIPLLGLKVKQDVNQRIDNLVRVPVFIRYLVRSNYKYPLEMISPVDHDIRLSIRIVGYGKNLKLMIVRDVTRLHQLEIVRRDFVANVSHELKTPLTVINGYLENLIDAEMEQSSQWLSILTLMHQQSGRMQQIVDDLLLLSRLETDEESPSSDPVPVPALVAAICKDTQLLANDKQQRVEVENNHELWLQGNKKELYSAFLNLAINAVKYTSQGGKIVIRWYLKGEVACFEVRDSGIGIAHEHIPRLTERFYRVDAGRSREQGGTGLGLAIVKHVLIRHHAKFSITSEIDKGSIFCCTFPFDRIILRENIKEKNA